MCHCRKILFMPFQEHEKPVITASHSPEQPIKCLICNKGSGLVAITKQPVKHPD